MNLYLLFRSKYTGFKLALELRWLQLD